MADDGLHARILRVVSRIPRGRVATYGQVAEVAGLPGQPRLVGYALHALPDFTPVPWQRVVNARGTISTTGGAAARQRQLLELEGVRFDGKGRIALDRFGWRPRSRAGTARREGGAMASRKRFPARVIEALRTGKIIGLRAGTRPHRFIGIWMVVVNDRLFVRSWGMKERSWWRTFQEEPRGTITLDGREIRVRAVRTRSERLKDAVSAAYRAKYDTPGAVGYVRGFAQKKRRETTTELVPR